MLLLFKKQTENTTLRLPLQLRPFIDKSLEIISYFLHATKALTDNIKDNNKIVHITCKKNYLS